MKTLIVLSIIAVLLFVVYRFVLPAAFVAAGRGSVSNETVSVVEVTVSDAAAGETGQSVDADPGMKFVHVDLKIDGTFADVDVYDFQLVKERAESLGTEENIGDNFSDNYFYWSAIDGDGNRFELTDLELKPIRLRLSFQVPEQANRGYLFYWGQYFGPHEF